MRYTAVAMVRQGDSEDELVFWVLISNMWRALALFCMGHLNMGHLAHGKQLHTTTAFLMVLEVAALSS